MNGTVYDPTLTDEMTPHVVELPHVMGRFEERKAWLAANGDGRYRWRRVVHREPRLRHNMAYRFTDADTAFWFKMATP